MTREEAIKELKEYEDELDLEYATPFDKAILYAIQALSQEPSRGWEEMTVPCENCGHDMTFKIAVCGEQEPCDDAISRADLGLTDFEIVMCNGDYKQALEMLIEKIQKAPPVTPSRHKGHWIETEYHHWRCSVCREKGMSDWDNIHNVRTNFCPDCGAEMESKE